MTIDKAADIFWLFSFCGFAWDHDSRHKIVKRKLSKSSEPIKPFFGPL
jgi:hypothetical protein